MYGTTPDSQSDLRRRPVQLELCSCSGAAHTRARCHGRHVFRGQIDWPRGAGNFFVRDSKSQCPSCVRSHHSTQMQRMSNDFAGMLGRSGIGLNTCQSSVRTRHSATLLSLRLAAAADLPVYFQVTSEGRPYARQYLNMR